MMIHVNKKQEMVQLDWTAKSLDQHSMYPGIGTALNGMLMLIIYKNNTRKSKEFITVIIEKVATVNS